MPKKLLLLAATLALISATPAAADSSFEAVPTGWKMLTYLDSEIVQLFDTPSSCVNGLVALPSNASNDTKNRFWSLIISARLSNSVVGIHYNPTSCIITSFYLKG